MNSGELLYPDDYDCAIKNKAVMKTFKKEVKNVCLENLPFWAELDSADRDSLRNAKNKCKTCMSLTYC